MSLEGCDCPDCLEGWTMFPKAAGPVEFSFERRATAPHIAQLRALGYRGDPVPWGYLTDRQALILIRRLEHGEPLWQPS